MTVIDWHAEVKEYKQNYDDDGIYEYIESLVPQYFGDIYQTYHDEIGTPLNIEIENHHIGLEIWQIMVSHIFEAYLEKFVEAWNELEQEEE